MSISKPLLVAIIAMITTQLLLNVKERALDIGTTESTSTSTAYNIVDLKAPSVSGYALPIFGYIITKSFLSPFLLRYLLNANGVHLIRELAIKIDINSHSHEHSKAPLFYPTHARSVTITGEERALADLHQSFLKSGIDMSMDSSSSSSSSSSSNISNSNNTGEKKKKFRSIMQYHNVYKSGTATPSQVMEELIIGADKLKHLKIFSSFRPEDIRKQARESDRRWKEGKTLSVFDGVPVAIKDQSSVAGHRLCRGSMISACVEVDSDGDDIPAKRLREAGAIIIGVTTMVEGGVSPLGYNVHFDGPFNPYDVDYYPGGSSSGSAVAVASGLVPMALGFDGGGSVRVPASMSGVYGLAVTQGRIPHNDSHDSTMVKAGPLAATIEDVALTLLLLGRVEPGAHYTKMIGEEYFPPPHLSHLFDSGGKYVLPLSSNNTPNNKPLEGTRIGIFWDHFGHTDDEVYEQSLRAVEYLEELGVEIVEISIPHLREIHLSHGITILSEFGMIWEKEFYNSSHVLEPNTQITIALGRTITSGEILSAAKVRRYAMNLVCKEIFEDLNIDAIASPMLGESVPKPGKGYRHFGESDNSKVYKVMRFVPLSNFLGLPGLSLPIGYHGRGNKLPIGFQLLGSAWSEDKLIDIGIHLEKSMERRFPENYYDVLAKFLK